MDLHHEIKDQILVIHLEGEVLDASQSQAFKEEVVGLIDKTDKAEVIFALERLRFIDSAGLGSFLSLLRYANSKGGDLKLAEMEDPVKKMFMVVRMHRLFEVFEDVKAACASFGRDRG